MYHILKSLYLIDAYSIKPKDKLLFGFVREPAWYHAPKKDDLFKVLLTRKDLESIRTFRYRPRAECGKRWTCSTDIYFCDKTEVVQYQVSKTVDIKV